MLKIKATRPVHNQDRNPVRIPVRNPVRNPFRNSVRIKKRAVSSLRASVKVMRFLRLIFPLKVTWKSHVSLLIPTERSALSNLLSHLHKLAASHSRIIVVWLSTTPKKKWKCLKDLEISQTSIQPLLITPDDWWEKLNRSGLCQCLKK